MDWTVVPFDQSFRPGPKDFDFDINEMSFARETVDRVCFLDGGAILEQGPPDRIFSAPAEAQTRQFLQRIVAAGRL